MESWSRGLAGEKIYGRWTKNTYKLIRYLGEGATGIVYIVKELPSGRLLALKMSKQFYTISSEVNVLKKLNQPEYTYKGPRFYDVDDGILSSTKRKVHFYTMEYIEGTPYRKFIEKNGQEWAVVFLLQMLKQLELLHQSGWVFGDLKVDNIIISKNKQEVRWFDVGGFTMLGRSVKEYTEFYDQGYWGVGPRKATVQYDLFSCSMIFLEAFYPKRFYKTKSSGKVLLRKKMECHRQLRWFMPIMENLWNGKYQSALQMHRDIQRVFAMRMQKAKIGDTKNKVKKKKGIFKQFLLKTSILLFIAGGYILYLSYQAP